MSQLLVSYKIFYLLVLEIISEANIGLDAQNKSDDGANKATIIFWEKVDSQKKEK